MHRFMTLVSLLSLLGLGAATALASTISVPLHPSIAVGDSFAVEVWGTDLIDLYAFQFDLAFDPSLLAVLNVSQGTLFGGSGGFFSGIVDNAGGSLSFVLDTLTGPVPGISGDGTLASVTFMALATGVSQLTLTNVILLESNLEDIDFSSHDGSVTVNAVTGVPEPGTSFGVLSGVAMVAALRHRRRSSKRTSLAAELLKSDWLSRCFGALAQHCRAVL